MKKFSVIIFSVIIAIFIVIILKDKSRKQESISEDENFYHEEVSYNLQKEFKPEESIPHPDTISAMMEKEFLGDNLVLGDILQKNESYTRYFIKYESEGFEISGVMNVPAGDGPFPVLVLNHGYIDPAIYKNGQGLKREQDYLARRGYVVIHSDYRNHAQSDFDPKNDVRPRSGYVEDIMNLLSAIDKSEFDFLDKENIGMLGHSMGGGITINIMTIAPKNVKAYVLMAPINANYRENFERWVVPEWPELAQQVFKEYGTFEENPEFWKGVSAVNYLWNIDAPIMLHQGDEDKDVPVQWARDLNANLSEEGKDVTYYEYPGEGHLFLNNFQTTIRRSADFFDENLYQPSIVNDF